MPQKILVIKILNYRFLRNISFLDIIICRYFELPTVERANIFPFLVNELDVEQNFEKLVCFRQNS